MSALILGLAVGCIVGFVVGAVVAMRYERRLRPLPSEDVASATHRLLDAEWTAMRFRADYAARREYESARRRLIDLVVWEPPVQRARRRPLPCQEIAS